jgi:hypothetical protein
VWTKGLLVIEDRVKHLKGFFLAVGNPLLISSPTFKGMLVS